MVVLCMFIVCVRVFWVNFWSSFTIWSRLIDSFSQNECPCWLSFDLCGPVWKEKSKNWLWIPINQSQIDETRNVDRSILSLWDKVNHVNNPKWSVTDLCWNYCCCCYCYRQKCKRRCFIGTRACPIVGPWPSVYFITRERRCEQMKDQMVNNRKNEFSATEISDNFPPSMWSMDCAWELKQGIQTGCYCWCLVIGAGRARQSVLQPQRGSAKIAS